VKELRLKSELLNSKLVPVSEYTEEIQEHVEFHAQPTFLGRELPLQINEIIAIQELHAARKLHIFEGEENSVDEILFVLQGLVLWVERNYLIERLIKYIRQRKSIITHLIE
jgi:hypothetical protein